MIDLGYEKELEQDMGFEGIKPDDKPLSSHETVVTVYSDQWVSSGRSLDQSSLQSFKYVSYIC